MRPERQDPYQAAARGDVRAIVESFCIRDDLSAFDPYDVWKTRCGLAVKELYYKHRIAGLLPAALVTTFDLYLNNERRAFYARAEYPIVRAMAALALLRWYQGTGVSEYLDAARKHVVWLAEHPYQGRHGVGWGIGFDLVIDASLRYGKNTPFSTITPYCLEAFLEYEEVSSDATFGPILDRIFSFFDQDLVVMEETDDWLATSYGPVRDRIVTNAVAYTMYSLALLLPRIAVGEQARVRKRIVKLWNFVRAHQCIDGSWFYSPREPSFIDCFHSCLVLKNAWKANQRVPLDGCEASVRRGFEYVKRTLKVPEHGLYKRFARTNKPGVIAFDLYDNAEMLGLCVLLGDDSEAEALARAIETHFVFGGDIFSRIDIFGRRKDRNTLRWAVMPYMRALTDLQWRAHARP